MLAHTGPASLGSSGSSLLTERDTNVKLYYKTYVINDRTIVGGIHKHSPILHIFVIRKWWSCYNPQRYDTSIFTLSDIK